MKNNLLKTTAVLLLCISALIACNHQAKQTDAAVNFTPLTERTDTIGKSAEWINIKQLYTKYTEALTKNPKDNMSRIKLAELYMNEARVTGQLAYYYEPALANIDYIEKNKEASKDEVYVALTYKASILLSLHQFAEAKKVADEAVKYNTYDAGIYGALVDANVELGNYKEAVALCDKMLSIRPDLRSYSRASYLREIYGDNNGAIDAMQMAVTAGPSGYESTEWARVKLGDLYLNTGKLDSAQLEYALANLYRPNYAYAKIGLAKVEKAKRNYTAAIDTTESVIRTLSEAAFVSFLGDLYELNGNKEKAEQIHSDVVDLLEQGEKEQADIKFAKHNGNRELAMAYLNSGKLDEALKYAQQDLNMRPENIDANQLIAWIYYKKGDYANAEIHTEKTMATNIKNPDIMYKAGLIYTAAGNTAAGNKLMREAQKINPNLETPAQRMAKSM